MKTTNQQNQLKKGDIPKKIKKPHIILLPLVFVAVTVLVCILYIHNVVNDTEDRVYQTINNSVLEQITTLNTDIDNEFASLNVYGNSLVFDDEFRFNSEKTLEQMSNVEQGLGAFHLYLADTEGQAYDADGKTYNVSKLRWFHQSMAGKNAVETVDKEDITKDAQVFFSVPVEREGKVLGVVAGSLSEEAFRSRTLAKNTNVNSGYSFLCKTDGSLVIGSEEKGNPLTSKNIFHLLNGKSDAYQQLSLDFKGKSTGYISFSLQGEAYYGVYRFTGVNDWMLFHLVAAEVVENSVIEVTKIAYTITFVVIFLSALTIFYLLMTNRRTRKILESERDALKERNEENDAVIAQSGKSIIRYCVKTKTAMQYGIINELFGTTGEIKDYPESAIEAGVFLPESIEVVRELFADIEKGVPEGSCNVHVRTKTGEKCWYHMDYSLIRHVNGEPSIAILSGFDNTDQFRKELAYRKLQNDLAAIVEKSAAYYEVNLTRDIIDNVEGSLLMDKGTSGKSKPFSLFFEKNIKPVVDPRDVEILENFFDKKRLLSLYGGGIYKDDIEVRSTINGAAEWYRIEAQMAEYPYSKEINLFIFACNIDAEHREKERLSALQSQDFLTTLLNREATERKIREALATMEEKDTAAIFMIDLDNFKQVNDIEGHQAGDEILKKCGTTIANLFRHDDIVGRFGGDEFMVLIPRGVTLTQVESKGRNLMEALQFFIGELVVTASVGIVFFQGSIDGDLLYSHVDTVLYRAKTEGKSRYCILNLEKDKEILSQKVERSAFVQFKVLLENMDGGIVLADVGKEVKITYLSRRFFKALKEKENESSCAQDLLASLIHPADLSEVIKTMKNAAVNNVADCTFRMCAEEERWFHLRAARLSQTQEKEVSVIGIVTDVTEMKKTEENLRIAKERYRLANELSNSLIWEVDIPTHTLYQSIETSHALGHDKDTYANVPDGLLDVGVIHPDSVDDFRRMYQDLYAGKDGKEYIILSKNDTGSYVWLKSSFRILRDENGKPVRSIGVAKPCPNIDTEMRGFQKEMRFMKLVSASSFHAGLVNLSCDLMEYPVLDREKGETISYTQQREMWKQHIFEDDLLKYDEMSDLNNLILEFREGKIWKFMEYRRIMSNGSLCWSSLAYNLIRHPVSNDIYAFIYARDIEKKKCWEMELASKVVCDGVTLLYNKETFAAIADIAIKDMPEDEQCALTIFEFGGFEKQQETNGFLVFQKHLSLIGRLFQFLTEDNLFAGYLDETHIAAFRVGKLSTERQYINVKSYMRRIQMLMDQVIYDIPITITCGYSLSDKENADTKRLMKEATLAVDTARHMPQSNIASYFAEAFPAAEEKNLIKETEHLYDLRLLEQTNLLRLAERDELTGIYNRNAFYHHLRERVQANPDANFLVLRWDIDNFKILNEVKGPDAGDRLLRDMANYLVDHFGSDGIYGRIQADHFVYFLEGDKEQAKTIAATITSWFDNYPMDYKISVRFGVYMIEDNGINGSLMTDRALMALKSIKGSFTNRIAFYDSTLRQTIVEEQELSEEMVNALEQKEFKIYFQPQYNYDTGELIGAEALVRWEHPKKGLISPGRFVPIFERNGFISLLDEYVWEESCRFLKKWQTAKLPKISLSVNVSRADIYNPNLCKNIQNLLKKYDLPISLLRLEITESAYMKDPKQLHHVVNELQNAGFTVEMDAFGAGYSSLNMLKDIPVDVLKLDLLFLSSVDNNIRGGKILSAVIRMAHWLNLPVLAEGVETKDQADYLKSLNCFYMQGFYFAKPMPAAAFEALLSQKEIGEMEVKPKDNFVFMEPFWDSSNEDFRHFCTMDKGCCVFDCFEKSLELIRINDAFFRTFSVTREDIINKPVFIYDILNKENGEKLEELIYNAIRNGEKVFCAIEKNSDFVQENGHSVVVSALLLAETQGHFAVMVTIEEDV